MLRASFLCARRWSMFIAMRLEPALAHLDRERSDQTQTARGVRDDADDVGTPPLDLLVEAFQGTYRLQARVLLARQGWNVSVSSVNASTRLHSLGWGLPLCPRTAAIWPACLLRSVSLPSEGALENRAGSSAWIRLSIVEPIAVRPQGAQSRALPRPSGRCAPRGPEG
jgi:hypothetical protein